MGKLKKLFKKQGFTLVELIIVIAIIAVLAVAAFMLLTKWLANSRDSRRLGDVSTVKKALNITFIEKPYYPEPDEKTEVLDEDGITMWYQGVFGSGVIQNMDNLQKAPVDPSDGSYFRYAVTMDQKEYQIGATLEKGEETSILNTVLAATLVANIDGDYDGYATYTSGSNTYIVGTPSLLLYTGGSLNTSGDNTNLMLNGKKLGSNYEIKSVEFSDATSNDDLVAAVRDIFGLTGDDADKEAMGIIRSNSKVTPSAISYATCPWNGGSISHGTSVTAYSATSVAYDETCSSVSETRTCNDGNLSGTYTNANCTSENALDCPANNQTRNGHSYDVAEIMHNNNLSVNSQTGSIANGIQYWTSEFNCMDGTVTTVGGEGTTITCDSGFVNDGSDNCVADACGGSIVANGVSNASSTNYGTNRHYDDLENVCAFKCDTYYTWNGVDTCIADTQEENCGGSIVTNGTANTAVTYIQTWDGDSWEPTISWGEGQPTCGFICDANYTWDGDSCEADTQLGNCGGTVVANATAITVSTYTQTWSGSAWYPVINWGESQVECDFDCNSNYSWDGDSCEVDSQVVDCGGSVATNGTATTVTTYSQTWNGTIWTPVINWGENQAECDFDCNVDYHRESSLCMSNTRVANCEDILPANAEWNTSSTYNQIRDLIDRAITPTTYNTTASTNDCRYKCSNGYHTIDGGTSCISDTKSCSITNGTGNQTWDGSARGDCTIVSCNAGYTATVDSCQKNSLMTNIIAYWDFNETTGTTINDKLGNGNDLSLGDSGVWMAGKVGGAGHIVNGRVRNTGLSFAGSAKTISFWFKFPDTTDTSGGFMAFENTSDIYKEDNLGQSIGSAAYGTYACNAQGYRNQVTHGMAISDTNWHFYSISKGTNTIVCLDGNCEYTAIDSVSGISSPNSITLNGGIGCGFGNFSQGMILDEVRMFSSTFTIPQLEQVYIDSNGSATSIVDYSGAKRWSNERYADNCNGYFQAMAYNNNGDGRYWVKPNTHSAFKVYCDMTTNGGGRTRYTNIKGDWTNADGLNCFKGSIISNATLECFNPNRYNFQASTLRIKKDGGNRYKAISTNPSYGTNTEYSTRRCTGHPDYMTVMDADTYPGSNPTSVTYVRLGINLCIGAREVGGMGGSTPSYMNYSGGGHNGPVAGSRETSADPAELYVR